MSVQNEITIITIDKDTRTKSGIIVGTPAPAVSPNNRTLYGVIRDPQPLRELRDRYAKSLLELEKARMAIASSRQLLEQMKGLHDAKNSTARKDLRGAEKKVRGDEEDLRAAEARLQGVEHEARAQWGDGVARRLGDHPDDIDRVIEGKDIIIEIAAPDPGSSSMPLTPAQVKTAGATWAPIELIASVPLIEPFSGRKSFLYSAPAAGTGLIPRMTISAQLPMGPGKPGVLIPESAVVWREGRAWLYIQKDPDHFVRREISTETPSPGGWFLAGESAASDPIVVQGAQLLLSEEFLSQYTIIEAAE